MNERGRRSRAVWNMCLGDEGNPRLTGRDSEVVITCLA